MKSKFGFLILAGFVLFSGCASKTKFSGKGEFCGVVVDENNQPVKDYVVNCVWNGVDRNVAVTNESGIFVLSNLPSGKYKIYGEKIGYGKISGEEFDFNSKSKIFCCKVNSINAVLKTVDKQIVSGNYEVAEKLLKEVSFEKDSYEEGAVIFYEACLNVLKENSKDGLEKIKMLKRRFGKEFSEEIQKLEVIFHEKLG